MTEPGEAPSATASIWIDAEPDLVWTHVADIETLGRHSPETTRTEWLPGSDSHRVGARFRGFNDNGRGQWHTDCEITQCDRGALFEFGVRSQDADGFATTWRYAMDPSGGGTLLTESFTSPFLSNPSPDMDPARRDRLAAMLRETLSSIKVEIESQPRQ